MTTKQERTLDSAPVEEVETEEVEQEVVEPVAEKRVLSASDVLDFDDLSAEEVPVPEWGGNGSVLLVRAMTGFERDKFEESLQGKNGGTNIANIRAKLVAIAAVDDEGNRLFTDADATKLGKKNAKALDRCFNAARRLSGLADADIDELAKNS